MPLVMGVAGRDCHLGNTTAPGFFVRWTVLQLLGRFTMRGARQVTPPHSIRLDYFHRAISKARNRTKRLQAPSLGGLRTPSPSEDGGSPLGGSAPKADADDREKAKICDHLSRQFGIRILRLLKISGKDPMDLMELEQGRIEFPNVGFHVNPLG